MLITPVRMNYNQSFGNKPLYAINKNGEMKRYKSRTEASEDLGITTSSIGNCANGGTKTTCGYIFMNYEDVKSKVMDRTGIKADEKKLGILLRDKFDDNPVYAVNCNGEYLRFYSPKDAGDRLGISTFTICNSVKGIPNNSKEWAFVSADKMENVSENGEITINDDVLNEAMKSVNRKSFYVIDKDGNYKKYNNKSEAAEDLGIDIMKIYQCLTNRLMKADDYTFVPAEEIEVKGKVGEVDKKELKKLLINNFENSPLYVIDEKGRYTRFTNRQDAAKAIGSTPSTVASCINDTRKYTVKNYALAPAESIEYIDENGNIIPQKELINKVVSESFSRKPIYVIDRNGNCTKYYTRNKAAQALGIDVHTITHCLRGDQIKTRGGYTFALPSEIEVIDDNGNIKINRKKVRELKNKINNNAIYALSSNRKYKKYLSIKEASDSLHLSEDSIQNCITGKTKRVRNYTFFKAKDIDIIDESNRCTQDFEALKKIYNDRFNK